MVNRDKVNPLMGKFRLTMQHTEWLNVLLKLYIDKDYTDSLGLVFSC